MIRSAIRVYVCERVFFIVVIGVEVLAKGFVPYFSQNVCVRKRAADSLGEMPD